MRQCWVSLSFNPTYGLKMNKWSLTANQIHELGIEALSSKLGTAGMIRFLHQHKMGKGNYSVDRHQWLTVPDVETLANQIQGAREDTDKERQKLDKAVETTLHGVFRKTVEAYKTLEKIDETMKNNPRDALLNAEEVDKELEKIDEAMKTILQRLSPMT